MEEYVNIPEEELASICLNCKHFGCISSWFKKDIQFKYLKNSGECRCNPPQASIDACGVAFAVFPIVKNDMWCGKFSNWHDDES